MQRQDKCKSQTISLAHSSDTQDAPHMSPKRSSYPCLNVRTLHHSQNLLTATGACGGEVEPEVRVTSLNERRSREKIDLRTMRAKSKSVDDAAHGDSRLRPELALNRKRGSATGSDVICEEESDSHVVIASPQKHVQRYLPKQPSLKNSSVTSLDECEHLREKVRALQVRNAQLSQECVEARTQLEQLQDVTSQNERLTRELSSHAQTDAGV